MSSQSQLKQQAPFLLSPFCSPGGNGCALQTDSISTQADWTSILLIFLTLKEEAEMEGHPSIPQTARPLLAFSLSAYPPALQPPPPPRSPFLLLAMCRPFLLGHKGLCRQTLCAVCQHGGPGTRRGRGRSQLPCYPTFSAPTPRELRWCRPSHEGILPRPFQLT